MDFDTLISLMIVMSPEIIFLVLLIPLFIEWSLLCKKNKLLWLFTPLYPIIPVAFILAQDTYIWITPSPFGEFCPPASQTILIVSFIAVTLFQISEFIYKKIFGFKEQFFDILNVNSLKRLIFMAGLQMAIPITIAIIFIIIIRTTYGKIDVLSIMRQVVHDSNFLIHIIMPVAILSALSDFLTLRLKNVSNYEPNGFMRLIRFSPLNILTTIFLYDSFLFVYQIRRKTPSFRAGI